MRPSSHRDLRARAPWMLALALAGSLDGCHARDGQSRAIADAAPSAAPAVDALAPSLPACPQEMALVDGAYCPRPEQVCLRWVDPPSSRFHELRCAAFAQPARCTAPRVHARFCIDREEYVRPGDALPLAHQSWTSAGALCATLGKRLCLESEWQFACEGEEMRPYPYGFERGGPEVCNIDRTQLGAPDGGLRDLRAPVTDLPGCTSPFGVHHMTGNVDEWATVDDAPALHRSSLKGGWWLAGRNNCRAATRDHDERYEGPQTGVRCCKGAAD